MTTDVQYVPTLPVASRGQLIGCRMRSLLQYDGIIAGRAGAAHITIANGLNRLKIAFCHASVYSKTKDEEVGTVDQFN